MSNPHTLVFTDLDGTLLNQDDYQFEAALPVLQRLHQHRIPVIPVTSKTRAEVEWIRQQVAPDDPFIVENGSAIFYGRGDRRFVRSQSDASNPDQRFEVVCLGCSYAEARQGLSRLSYQVNTTLGGFSDLSEDALAELTGLKTEEIQRAKYREFTEPFVTPRSMPADMPKAAAQLGFRLVVGDRFSHLIGQNAGKGRAVRQVIAAYQSIHPHDTVHTIGLGNSPNDLEMLEVVDQAIVIPGRSGPHPELCDRGWAIAPLTGCRGWAASVAQYLDKTLLND